MPPVASNPPRRADSRGRQKDAEEIEILFRWLAAACHPAKILRPSDARPSKRSLFHRVSARIFGAAAHPALACTCVWRSTNEKRDEASRRRAQIAPDYLHRDPLTSRYVPVVRGGFLRSTPVEKARSESAILLSLSLFLFFLSTSLVECRGHVPSPALARDRVDP